MEMRRVFSSSNPSFKNIDRVVCYKLMAEMPIEVSTGGDYGHWRKNIYILFFKSEFIFLTLRILTFFSKISLFSQNNRKY